MSASGPRVVGFCCEKHGIEAAILSARSGRGYDASVRLVKVPCTGRVDSIHILKALEDGADAVFIVGCLEENCYYDTGSTEGRKRVMYVKSMLEELGIEKERVEMFNISSTMTWKFPEIAEKMVETAKRLGPLVTGGERQ